MVSSQLRDRRSGCICQFRKMCDEKAHALKQFPSLAPAQVFNLFGNVGQIGLTGPPGTQQLGVAHGPRVKILLVEIHVCQRVFNCSGRTA